MMEFTEVNMGDEPAADVDPLHDDTLCVVDGCGKPRKAYGGRGKRPTKCDDHSLRPGVKGTGEPRAKAWKETMAVQLNAQMVGIGMLVGQINEFDGMAIINGSENFVARTIELAEADPKFRKGVENALKGNAYAGWVVSIAAIAVPILANHKMLPAKMMAMMGGKS